MTLEVRNLALDFQVDELRFHCLTYSFGQFAHGEDMSFGEEGSERFGSGIAHRRLEKQGHLSIGLKAVQLTPHGDFGFWILDLGLPEPVSSCNPKSKI